MKNAVLFACSILSIASILSSCSESLTREQAEKLIREKYQFPHDEIIYMYVRDATSSMGLTIGQYKKLQNEGLLTYSECGSGSGRGICATLTEKGKPYATSEPYRTDNQYIKQINVKGAKLDFGQITGILEQKESNTAEVQFQMIREANPFGITLRRMSSGTVNKTATFKKYDDGWRIIN